MAKLKLANNKLEMLNKQLKEQGGCERCDKLGLNDLAGPFAKRQIGDGLPREPEKYNLQGHRGKITKVIAHPLYSIVASASEDSSIRLWEIE